MTSKDFTRVIISWEHIRQIGSDICLHTIAKMDVYLIRLEEKV